MRALWTAIACGLLLFAAAEAGGHCGPLTKELLQKYAKDNTVLISVIDKIVWKCFGPSFVENIQATNITYWLVAALDPETSVALAEAGVEQCFNAPQDRLAYKGSETNYKWGSNHWTQTTWNKVHVMHSVYEHGFHIIHSDADVVWFNDPLPFFMKTLEGPAQIIIATDALVTQNGVGDVGVEAATSPHTNINTGIYFMRNWPGGESFFKQWLWWQGQNKGHDQDGFNYFVRGQWFHGDNDMPTAVLPKDPGDRLFYAAFHNTTAISFLPASMFGNAYTYVNARLWEKLKHPLYEVHWVWGGSTLESKRQNMRDAMKFHDEPPYYEDGGLRLVSYDLDQMPTPEGFNSWPLERTEDMIRFHVRSANHQLRQTYFAFAAALVLNRTLVMPRFQCHCSKNWYQTQSCRINHERMTTFPFTCALSHVMRVKLLEQGTSLPPETHEYNGHKVHIREYSFLENPKVPLETRSSWLEVVPGPEPVTTTPTSTRTPEQLVLSTQDVPAGSGPKGLPGAGKRLVVAAPLTDAELKALLQPYGHVRVVHFTKPHKTLRGFVRPETHDAFDGAIQKKVTHWCCRSPPDMQRLNLTERVQLLALPGSRLHNLPPPPPRASYLHEVVPEERQAAEEL